MPEIKNKNDNTGPVSIHGLKFASKADTVPYPVCAATWNELRKQLREDKLYQQKNFAFYGDNVVVVQLSNTSLELFTWLAGVTKIPINRWGENKFKEDEFEKALEKIYIYLILRSK